MRMHLGRTWPVVGSVLASMTAHAQAPQRSYDGWHWNWGWEHIVFGSIMMIVFWGGVILLIVLAVRWMGGASASQASPRQTPMDILEERFARGEIDEQEFLERRRHLSE